MGLHRPTFESALLHWVSPFNRGKYVSEGLHLYLWLVDSFVVYLVAARDIDLPHPNIMSKKTISTGTLSLRFMQNAHRAKNLAEVEAEKAEVKDDGKWEVSGDVKQAWGLGVAPQ